MLSSIEICAGAGGQALGLEMAGFEHVALIEYEKDYCETLKRNRPDWNVICGDADGAKSSAEIYNNIVNGSAEKIPTLEEGEEIVILCHENHEITVNAMEDVINWGLDQGYTFLPLTKDSYPKHHTIHN